jgi:hypothetical protein
MIAPPAHDAYDRALMSERPSMALREVAQQMLSGGVTRDELLEQFEELRSELRAAHRLSDEDAVLDVMDDLEGFTAPHMSL